MSHQTVYVPAAEDIAAVIDELNAAPGYDTWYAVYAGDAWENHLRLKGENVVCGHGEWRPEAKIVSRGGGMPYAPYW